MSSESPAAEPIVRRWLPVLLATALKGLSATWRIAVENPEVLEEALARGPVVFAIWHAQLLALMCVHAGRGFVCLVSHSRDGDLLARALPRFGYGVVRGSSSRGARDAWVGCQEALAEGRSPVLAVDGPRGPRHVPQRGALTLSADTGRPIAYLVALTRPVLRLRTWDRFEIPLPWARVRVRYGLLAVEDGSACAVEDAARALGEAMEALSARDSTPPGPGTAPPPRAGPR